MGGGEESERGREGTCRSYIYFRSARRTFRAGQASIARERKARGKIRPAAPRRAGAGPQGRRPSTSTTSRRPSRAGVSHCLPPLFFPKSAWCENFILLDTATAATNTTDTSPNRIEGHVPPDQRHFTAELATREKHTSPPDRRFTCEHPSPRTACATRSATRNHHCLRDWRTSAPTPSPPPSGRCDVHMHACRPPVVLRCQHNR